MNHTISTLIEINSTKEKVWSTLINTSDYQWAEFLNIKGTVAPGAQLEVDLDMSSKQTFKPTVTSFKPNERLSWLGKLLIGGIFDGEHIFEIEEANGKVLLKQTENFYGILVYFTSGMLDRDVKPGFERFNEALKKKVESL